MASSYDKVMANKNFLPLKFDQLTPRMIQMAKEELNENEKTRSSSIKQLKELVTKEKNLKYRTDDEFLLQFLRARKFDLKKAFSRFQTFYQVCEIHPDVFADLDDEKIQKVFKVGFGSHLPYRDREGAAVGIIKISNWKTEDIDVCSILTCFIAMALTALEYPATQVCGFHAIIDIGGFSFQHFRCFNFRLLCLVAKGLRDFLPVRFKGLHFINNSALFRNLWTIINIFLSEKIRQRVRFHDYNMESLHKFIPKEILPAEYGGEYSDFDPVRKDSKELEKFRTKYQQIIRGECIN